MLNYADQKIKIVVGADTTKAQSKLQALGGKMKSALKMGAVAGTAALAAGVAGSIKVFSSFEQEMANVQTVTNATGDTFERLKDLATSKEVTMLGYSATQAAQAMYYLGSAGWDATQSAEALSGVLKLTSATQSDMALVSEKVAATITMFGLEASDAEMVADKFATTIAGSQATMEKLADSMTYAGPMFSQLGYSLDDTLAALGSLYNLGIPASQAGTALRQSLNALMDPAGDAASALKELGLTVQDVSPESNTFSEILAKLGDSGASTTQMLRILGVEGMSVGKLAEDSGESFGKLKDAIAESGGTADRMANQQMNTLSGAFKILKNSVMTSGIAFGDWMVSTFNISGRLRSIAGGIMDFTDSLKEAFDTGDFSQLGEMLGDLVTFLPKKAIDLFSDIDFMGLSNSLFSIFNTVVESFKKLLFETDWSEFGESIFDALAGVGTFVYNTIFNTDWVGVFNGLLNMLRGIGTGIYNRIEETNWSGVWGTLKEELKGIKEGIIEAFEELDKEDIQAAVDKVLDAVRWSLDVSTKLLKWINENLGTVADDIRSGKLNDVLNRIGEGISDGIANYETPEGKNGVQALLQKMLMELANLDLNIQKIRIGISDALIDFRFSFPEKLLSGIAEQLFGKTAGKAVGLLWKGITLPISLPLKAMLWGEKRATDLIQWILDGGWKNPKEAIINLGSKIKGWLKTIVDWILDKGTTVKNATIKLGSTISGWLKNFVDWVRSAGSEFKSIIVSVSWPSPPGWLNDLLSLDFSGLNIPGLASGGIVDKPTFAMIGEAGPEAVIPLDRLQHITPPSNNAETIVVENINISLPTAQKLTKSEIDNMTDYLRKRLLELGKRRKGLYFG
jgi:TP901 family phage tail tape measure protein